MVAGVACRAAQQGRGRRNSLSPGWLVIASVDHHSVNEFVLKFVDL